MMQKMLIEMWQCWSKQYDDNIVAMKYQDYLSIWNFIPCADKNFSLQKIRPTTNLNKMFNEKGANIP